MLLEKGTVQSHPDMGVGIISRYRYSYIDKLNELQDDIQNQISTYLPDLQGVNVIIEASSNDQEILIKISVNDVLYTFKTDTPNNTINLLEL